jgi:hypothetical protein
LKCGCDPKTPIGITEYLTYYVRITNVAEILATTFLSIQGSMQAGDCWADDMLGDFVIEKKDPNDATYSSTARANGIAMPLTFNWPGRALCLNAGETPPQRAGNPTTAVPLSPGYPRFSLRLEGCNSRTGLFGAYLSYYKWRPGYVFGVIGGNEYGWSLGGGINQQGSVAIEVVVPIYAAQIAYCKDKRSRIPLFYNYITRIGSDPTPITNIVQVGEISTHPFT